MHAAISGWYQLLLDLRADARSGWYQLLLDLPADARIGWYELLDLRVDACSGWYQLICEWMHAVVGTSEFPANGWYQWVSERMAAFRGWYQREMGTRLIKWEFVNGTNGNRTSASNLH
jgi:hypothetical protein